MISSHSRPAGTPASASASDTTSWKAVPNNCRLLTLTARLRSTNESTALAPPPELHQRRPQNGRAEIADQTGLLGHRQELIGTEQSAIGVPPSGQHLEAGQHAGVQIDDRLVVRHDLVALDASTKFVGGAQGDDRCVVHALGEDLDAVAAASLGAVHGRVGIAQQVAGGHIGAIGNSDADAAGDEQLDAVDGQRPGDLGAQPLGRGGRRAVGRVLAEDDDELVATEPAEHVVIAQHRAQSLRHAAQQLVAGGVAQAVVDDLEVVDVDEQDGDRADVRRRQQLGQLGGELRAVRQARQLVVRRRPTQLLGGSPLLGDVLHVGDGQRFVLVVEHRHRRLRPHDRSVGAQVALLESERLDRSCRGADEHEAGPRANRRDG